MGGEHEEGEGTELSRGAGMREGESWGGESESGIGSGKQQETQRGGHSERQRGGSGSVGEVSWGGDEKKGGGVSRERGRLGVSPINKASENLGLEEGGKVVLGELRDEKCVVIVREGGEEATEERGQGGGVDRAQGVAL